MHVSYMVSGMMVDACVRARGYRWYDSHTTSRPSRPASRVRFSYTRMSNRYGARDFTNSSQPCVTRHCAPSRSRGEKVHTITVHTAKLRLCVSYHVFTRQQMNLSLVYVLLPTGLPIDTGTFVMRTISQERSINHNYPFHTPEEAEHQ